MQPCLSYQKPPNGHFFPRGPSTLLKMYTDECFSVIGKLHMHVEYKQQKAKLALIVVTGNGPNMPGRIGSSTYALIGLISSL